jgi:hypothetical protein
MVECSPGAERQSSQLQAVETVSAPSMDAVVSPPTELNFTSAAAVDTVLTCIENDDSRQIVQCSTSGDSRENVTNEDVTLDIPVRNSSPCNSADSIAAMLDYYVSYSSPCSDITLRDVWLNDAVVDEISPSP